MKDSLAKALRHSREMAQNTYDRRTAAEKNTMAVSLARQAAEQAEESTAGGEDEDAIKVGDFVAVVEADSTIQQPRILLARVQAFLPEVRWWKPLQFASGRFVLERILGLPSASVCQGSQGQASLLPPAYKRQDSPQAGSS